MPHFRPTVVRSLAVWAIIALAAPALAVAPADFNANFTGVFPQTVSLRAWAPDDVSRIRGVVFSLPGSGGDSRGTTANAAWQQRLRQMGFAYVGVRDLPGYYWGLYANETAQNMQIMLDGAAAALGRPEISNAPMFVYGISHGGIGASTIAQEFATRTLGFYADKGSSPAIEGFGEAQRNVPGIMTAGSSDQDVPPSFVYDNFASWGPNARVSFAIEWGFGHVNTPENLRLAFMEEIIECRYPAGRLPSLTPNTPLPLVTLPLSSGWRGAANTVTYVQGVDQVTPIVWPTIAPYAQYAGPQPSSWLPSEAMAMVYRAQNDRPVGIAANALNFTANYASEPGVFVLSVSLPGTTYSAIDVYHDGERIAELGYAAEVQQIVYPTVDSGHHTFVAVATYTYGGQTHYTSKFATIDTFGPSASDLAGDFDHDGQTTSADLSVWSEHFGLRDYGLRGDGDGNGVVDGADFLSWQRQLGSGTPIGGAVPAPEPGAVGLAVMALAALVGIRLAVVR